MLLFSDVAVTISIFSHQVKTQYLQMLNIVDSAIKRGISGQSITVEKKLYNHVYVLKAGEFKCVILLFLTLLEKKSCG